MTDLADRTAPERKRRFNAKMRAKGFRELYVWLHPDDRALIGKLAALLRQHRENQDDARLVRLTTLIIHGLVSFKAPARPPQRASTPQPCAPPPGAAGQGGSP